MAGSHNVNPEEKKEVTKDEMLAETLRSITTARAGVYSSLKADEKEKLQKADFTKSAFVVDYLKDSLDKFQKTLKDPKLKLSDKIDQNDLSAVEFQNTLKELEDGKKIEFFLNRAEKGELLKKMVLPTPSNEFKSITPEEWKDSFSALEKYADRCETLLNKEKRRLEKLKKGETPDKNEMQPYIDETAFSNAVKEKIEKMAQLKKMVDDELEKLRYRVPSTFYQEYVQPKASQRIYDKVLEREIAKRTILGPSNTLIQLGKEIISKKSKLTSVTIDGIACAINNTNGTVGCSIPFLDSRRPDALKALIKAYMIKHPNQMPIPIFHMPAGYELLTTKFPAAMRAVGLELGIKITMTLGAECEQALMDSNKFTAEQLKDLKDELAGLTRNVVLGADAKAKQTPPVNTALGAKGTGAKPLPKLPTADEEKTLKAKVNAQIQAQQPSAKPPSLPPMSGLDNKHTTDAEKKPTADTVQQPPLPPIPDTGKKPAAGAAQQPPPLPPIPDAGKKPAVVAAKQPPLPPTPDAGNKPAVVAAKQPPLPPTPDAGNKPAVVAAKQPPLPPTPDAGKKPAVVAAKQPPLPPTPDAGKKPALGALPPIPNAEKQPTDAEKFKPLPPTPDAKTAAKTDVAPDATAQQPLTASENEILKDTTVDNKHVNTTTESAAAPIANADVKSADLHDQHSTETGTDSISTESEKEILDDTTTDYKYYQYRGSAPIQYSDTADTDPDPLDNDNDKFFTPSHTPRGSVSSGTAPLTAATDDKAEKTATTKSTATNFEEAIQRYRNNMDMTKDRRQSASSAPPSSPAGTQPSSSPLSPPISNKQSLPEEKKEPWLQFYNEHPDDEESKHDEVKDDNNKFRPS